MFIEKIFRSLNSFLTTIASHRKIWRFFFLREREREAKFKYTRFDRLFNDANDDEDDDGGGGGGRGRTRDDPISLYKRSLMKIIFDLILDDSSNISSFDFIFCFNEFPALNDSS